MGSEPGICKTAYDTSFCFIEVSPESGISMQKMEETKVALRELGLNDNLNAEESGQNKAQRD